MYREKFETFELHGLTFAAFTASDDSMGPPWKEHDGHGSIRETSSRDDKRPGEVMLTERGRHGWAYDVQGTLKIAARDGWGLNDESRDALTAKLGRAPTLREVRAEAVRLDCERMRAWLADEWRWVGVIVELQDTDDNGTGEDESLWGIESDSPDYHAEVARDLAAEIARRLNLADAKGKRRKTFKRETAARSESIRVRP